MSAIMRLLFPLVTLVAFAQASSNSLHQRQAHIDACSYLGCLVSFPSPVLLGKTLYFGDIGETILLSLHPSCAAGMLKALFGSFGRPMHVPFICFLRCRVQHCARVGGLGSWHLDGHRLFE